MKGRAPICLKCRQSGHLRKDCPEKSTASYAAVTRTPPVRRPNQAPDVSDIPVPPVPVVEEVEVLQPTIPSVTSVPEPEATTSTVIADIPSVSDTVETNSHQDSSGAEKRTELFDVDTLSWELVQRKKRMKTSNSEEEDTPMDTSQP
ncbi:hypothetical protein ACJMK2_035596 [Sinanodonta woodiana]|uniref:CCHC-type domain-containing protein n=1 Tax=Sinanodonta woodiana TaxID=1069815 RepID=A0ABD3WVE8_SINWO